MKNKPTEKEKLETLIKIEKLQQIIDKSFIDVRYDIEDEFDFGFDEIDLVLFNEDGDVVINGYDDLVETGKHFQQGLSVLQELIEESKN